MSRIREEVNSWLRQVGRDVGHDLSLGDDDSCAFSFGPDLVGVVTVPFGSDEVVFHATLATVTEADSAAILADAMRLNLHASATHGNVLGFDDDTGEIILSRRWPWNMVSPDAFGTLLGNFIGSAIELNKLLAENGDESPKISSPSEENPSDYLHWRV